MHKEVLRAIAGIDVFPVVSLVLFVIVFAIATVHAFRLDRQLVDELSSLPFEPAPGRPDAPGTGHALGTQHSALGTQHSALGTGKEVSRGTHA